MNRRDFLDAEVRKIMDKKEPTVAELERQNELLDQWAMLQWQRAAVLNPKAGSGVPGSPTHWSVTLIHRVLHVAVYSVVKVSAILCFAGNYQPDLKLKFLCSFWT